MVLPVYQVIPRLKDKNFLGLELTILQHVV
ncbi:Uncharacterized protein HZ326_28772, partial [Fusarium oxysporum f. sp. albedinis]